MIGTKFYKPLSEESETAYSETAKWCNETQAGFIEDKGDWYEVVAIPEPEQPTAQDIINEYDNAIEQWLDSTVQQRNYKNVESCISYEGDNNPKYAREAEAVKAWRSAVYTQAEVLIAQYIGGDISAVPPIETIIAGLPQLDWNDPVEPVFEEVSDGEIN